MSPPERIPDGLTAFLVRSTHEPVKRLTVSFGRRLIYDACVELANLISWEQ